MSTDPENESATQPATQPAIHPVVSGLKDFSEKFSPVLVKELRQGMRAHSFSVLFLIVQIILGLIVFGLALSRDTDGSGETMSRFMIGLYAIAVTIVQPLRGMTALHSEIRGNTIDLLVLTKLSAWRITFGKWCSLFAQSLLLLVTLVPYIIMRYFFGGMQLFCRVDDALLHHHHRRCPHRLHHRPLRQLKYHRGAPSSPSVPPSWAPSASSA